MWQDRIPYLFKYTCTLMTHGSRQAVHTCTSWEYEQKSETVTLNGSIINISHLGSNKLQCN